MKRVLSVLSVVALFGVVTVTARAGCGRCLTCSEYKEKAREACMRDGKTLRMFSCYTNVNTGCGIFRGYSCNDPYGGVEDIPEIETCEGN